MPSLLLMSHSGHRLSIGFPLTTFQRYNLLEFKSPTDPLTPDEYKRVIARAYLFLAEVGENDLREVTVTIITATKPRKVLKGVPQLVRFAEEASGRYISDDKLSVSGFGRPRNCLWNGEITCCCCLRGDKNCGKLYEAGARGMVGNCSARLPLAPKRSIGGVAMSRRYPTLEENIRFIVRDLGAEKLLRKLWR
jgi:hypothetical protein